MTDITNWMNSFVDHAAAVIAGAVTGSTIFAAGVTTAVTNATPQVVPLADDFTEAGLPAVMVAATTWPPALQPGNQRVHLNLACSVWRPRVPLGQNVAALYADAAAIADAFIAHGKLGITDVDLQAFLKGGPGIVPVSLPSGQQERTFLTLPFDVGIVFNRYVVIAPA